MKKNLTVVLAAVLAAASLAACGSSETKATTAAATEAAATSAATEAAKETGAAGETEAAKETEAAAEAGSAVEPLAEAVDIKIGATPSPHAEILEQAKDDLAAAGINLDIVVYNDYVQPNLATDQGEIQANYFQHQPYLDDFNAENGPTLHQWELSTMSRSESTQERQMIFQTSLTRLRSLFLMIQPMRLVHFSFFRLTASSLLSRV